MPIHRDPQILKVCYHCQKSVDKKMFVYIYKSLLYLKYIKELKSHSKQLKYRHILTRLSVGHGLPQQTRRRGDQHIYTVNKVTWLIIPGPCKDQHHPHP